jgi:hypothetical protein
MKATRLIGNTRFEFVDGGAVHKAEHWPRLVSFLVVLVLAASAWGVFLVAVFAML